MFHLVSKPFVRLIATIVAITCFVAGVFTPASSVFASSGEQTTTASATPNADLVKGYKLEQQRLVTQQANLDKTTARVARVQAIIDKANGLGKDTTSLVAALAIFQTQIATAENSHTTAASILSTHNGFDENGLVTDRDAAHRTVVTAHQSLEDCRIVLLQANHDLDRALAQWARDQKLVKVEIILKFDFKAEQKWLNVQQTHLDHTANVVTNVQALIAKAKDNGKDTSELENALAVYQSQVATAQSSHATAASILATHSGFDANGNVTDRDAARLTVDSARQSLADAHHVLYQAAIDLHHAILDWRANNK